MTTKDTMKLSDKTVYLALMMVERELDCYRSNLQRKCYTDAEQLAYVENLVEDLEKAVVELQAL
jgi:hypothetical protein